MRELIGQWGKALEVLIARERGAERFKTARRDHEYINVIGHDNSILEVVLNRGVEPYCSNAYTRVVWSERKPLHTPFAFKRYYALDFTDKPKQAFYDDQAFEPEYLTAAEVAERLFESLPLPQLKLRGHPPSRLDLTPLLKAAE